MVQIISYYFILFFLLKKSLIDHVPGKFDRRVMWGSTLPVNYILVLLITKTNSIPESVFREVGVGLETTHFLTFAVLTYAT